MHALTVASVTVTDPSAPDAPVRGWLDTPVGDATRVARSIDLHGWVFASDPNRRVHDVLVDGHSVLRVTVPVDTVRDDVAAAHRDRGDARTSGFAARIPTLGLPEAFQLSLVVRFTDGAIAPWATISGTQHLISPSYRPALAPIVVNASGRSGSTWLMRVLAAHPSVVVYPQHPHEVRRLTHWMHAVRVLSDQVDPDAIRRNGGSLPDRGAVGHDQSFDPDRIGEPELVHWLAHEHPTIVADLALRSVDEFYVELARLQLHTIDRFAEKVWFGQRGPEITAIARQLYPGTREILLLRDPRDLACSRLAFNRQRAAPGFGIDADATAAMALISMRDAIHHQAEYLATSAPDTVVRYESLVADPHSTVRELFTGLQLDHDDQLVTDVVVASTTDGADAREHRTRSEAAATVGRWRDDLSTSEQELASDLFGGALEVLGYD